MIQIELPFHLRMLAHSGETVWVDVGSTPTLSATLDAIESRYPVLQGTIRDHVTKKRRPFIRFYACEQDFSNEPPDVQLPDDVILGKKPLLIIGAIAGG
jgi:sulfur-carrier protein